MPQPKPSLFLLLALASLAGSLWLFFHGWLPVAVAPDEPLIPVTGANGKVGFINGQGREVSAFRWDSTDGYGANGVAAVSRDRKVGWIDRRGALAMPLRWEIPAWEDAGHLPLIDKGFDAKGWALVFKDGKFGWVDRDGREMLPFAWENAQGFEADGLARVQRDKLCGFINRERKVVVPLEWDSVSPFDDAGMALVQKNDLFGFINREGKLVIPLEWQDATDFEAGGLSRVKRSGRYGWINRRGDLAVPLAWSFPGSFHGKEMARVTNNLRQYGWINREGRVVVPLQWEEAEEFDAQGMARVSQGKKWGWINREGKTVIPLRWDLASDFDERGLARVHLGRRMGWINRVGEWADDSRFVWVEKFDQFNEAWAISKESKLSRIDRSGNLVKEFSREDIYTISGHSSSLVIVKDNNHTEGCMDRTGQWIVPLGKWWWVTVKPAVERDKEGHLWVVSASHPQASAVTWAWQWLASRISLFLTKASSSPGPDAGYYAVYDDLANRVIWTSDDRPREIWLGTGLAALAAGAWLWGRKKAAG